MSSQSRSRSVTSLAIIACVVVLSGCAGTAGGGARPAFGAAYPQPPEGEVIGQGTVLDVDGEAQLCLGAVAESYPPQCSGIPLIDWSWEGVDGSETSEQTTWGAYAVQGTYDGDVFTVTAPPIMLALYDPLPFPDPTGGEPGAGDEDALLALQEELPDRLGDQYLSSSIDNDYLWVDVVWDDGTLQDAANSEFGDAVVVVRSALREVP